MKRLLTFIVFLAACATGNTQTLTTVDLRMEETPPPSSVAPSHTTYVAWVDPADATEPMRKIGALRYDDDAETAMIGASVAREQYDIVVTSEPNERVVLPSGLEVLRTRCDFRDDDPSPCEVLQ